MKYFFAVLLLAVTGGAFAQDFSYLDNVELETAADFTPANDANAVKAVDYLMSTPFDKKNNNRKLCFRYLSRYAVKTPFITVTVDAYWGKIYKGNEEMLEMLLGLWLKTAINNKTATKEEIEKTIFTEIYKYAKAGNNVKKTDPVKSLIEAGDKGEIAQWLAKEKS